MRRVLLVAALVIGWALCGYDNYHYTLGWFTHRWPDQCHTGVAWVMALGGPLAVPAVMLDHGGTNFWLSRPYTKAQRWQEFHKQWPGLSRDYFDRNDCE